MKRGRTDWTCRCPRTTLASVLAAADADVDSARGIYDRWNLGRYVRGDAFAKWLRRRRRERAARRTEDSAGPSASAPSLTSCSSPASSDSPTDSTSGGALALCLEAMTEAVQRGATGKVDLAGAIRALAALEKLRLEGQAEKRAQELHETRMTDYRAKQEAALEGVSKASQLTPEQVAEIRLKVLGL